MEVKDKKTISKKYIRRFLRYIIMFFILFLASQYIPECKISYESAFILSTIGAISFALLDMYYPLVPNI
jgi:hypothetical protein